MDREKVENVLLEMGIPLSVKGFGYIADAMEIFKEKGTRIQITKELYPTIAKKNDSTAPRVERAIRHAFKIARSCKGDYEIVEKYIGFANCTNSASLATLYKRIEQEEGGGKKSKEPERGEHDQPMSEAEVGKIVRREMIRMFGELAKAGLQD